MKPSDPLQSFRVFHQENLLPSLQAVIQATGLNDSNLTVGMPSPAEGKMPTIADRQLILVTDGVKIGEWRAPSLRELFRGNTPAPADIHKYPPEYAMCFHYIETHVKLACNVCGDQTDAQFEEIYSNLRRRPDGKSLNLVHAFLWQVAAVLLAQHPLSQSEFEGIFRALTLSAKHWQQGGSSRNYMTFLHNMKEVMKNAQNPFTRV